MDAETDAPSLVRLSIMTRARALRDGFAVAPGSRFLALIEGDNGSLVAVSVETEELAFSMIEEMSPPYLDVLALPGELEHFAILMMAFARELH